MADTAWASFPGAANIHAFQVLYYLSSFWGQFGPNATTWLLAGEVYPTEMRAVGHGLSAATGKVTFLHILILTRLYSLLAEVNLATTMGCRA